jgi:hypothetical protein
MKLYRHIRSESGVVLIIVLWVLIFLISIAFTLAYTTRLEIKIHGNYDRKSLTKHAAEVGVAMAMERLSADYKSDVDARHEDSIPFYELAESGDIGSFYDCSYDNLQDVWNMDPAVLNTFPEDPEIDEDVWDLSISVIDERSKIPLLWNWYNDVYRPEILYHLILLLAEENSIPIDEDEARIITWAIIDSIDEDDIVGKKDFDALVKPPGWGDLENNFYKSQRFTGDSPNIDFDDNFKMRNAPFIQLDDLLNVPGMSEQFLYADPNEEDSTGLIDYISIIGATNEKGYFIDPATPRFTDHEPRININTVSPLLLNAMLRAAAVNQQISEEAFDTQTAILLGFRDDDFQPYLWRYFFEDRSKNIQPDSLEDVWDYGSNASHLSIEVVSEFQAGVMDIFRGLGQRSLGVRSDTYRIEVVAFEHKDDINFMYEEKNWNPFNSHKRIVYLSRWLDFDASEQVIFRMLKYEDI